MTSAKARRPTEGKDLVAFEVGDILYAVDLGRVREIIRPMRTMSLPHLPPSVVGVVDHRGDVAPVIDLRLRFALDDATRPTAQRWVIVKKGERLTGLVVDTVTEVFGGDAPEHRELPEIGAGEVARGIASVCSHRGRLVFVLDVDTLVAAGEQIDVASARDQLSSWRPDAHG